MEALLSAEDLPRYFDYLDRFRDHRILVVGDIMVDQFIWGRVDRISPEAPVPVVCVTDESFRLGGATNVVNNVRALGGMASVSGVVGRDEMGRMALRMLENHGVDAAGVVLSEHQRTTIKTRIIAHSQQVVRVDREDAVDISPEVRDKMLEYLAKVIPEVDGVVLSDYNKGVMVEGLVSEVIRLCRDHGVKCAVDPKVARIGYYKSCTVITPNHIEASRATGISLRSEGDMKRIATALRELLDPEAVLITYGEKGMVLLGSDSSELRHIDAVARSVYDVTGAGDTVISTLILALASGATMLEAAVLSNFAAGVAVGKVGTATVTIDEIKRELRIYTS
jgi:D-beta-D-heptose 7-phosphate kinase/D-beta-D-heptose 1-phosphate adenosyltransferase